MEDSEIAAAGWTKDQYERLMYLGEMLHTPTTREQHDRAIEAFYALVDTIDPGKLRQEATYDRGAKRRR
jgi:hypothetical protein